MQIENSSFRTVTHHVDFCVVGGGLAGLCAAVAAARHGAQVILMQDRPMLGGNASSEVRMWVCGAQGDNKRETGLIEEIMLKNLYRNPDCNYSLWDSVLYELAFCQERLTLLLNCTCMDCRTANGRICSVTGWQMTTQTFHTVEAVIFADCSGDSILAPLSGALFRYGRESTDEFGEDIAPATKDSKTMGMSCLIQAREEACPSVFIPPKWAYHFTKEDLPCRIPNMDDPYENFWYMELGGEDDTIADTEYVRDDLLKVAYGVWDFVKNAPENRKKNQFWRLDWVGMLPGKRESRRYVGDYILTQNDVRDGGRFDDLTAYGGWSMDDHNPAGIRSAGAPTVFHSAPSPYGIPIRCLYSKNIENLMFAGRNISVTHTAMSSTRVMATCALCGQAVGTAAAIAVKEQLSPRGIYELHIRELQRILMDDDCWLPGFTRTIPILTKEAELLCDSPDAENLRNGIDRPTDSGENGIKVEKGSEITYRFSSPQTISRVRIVFDSDLNRVTLPDQAVFRNRNMMHNRPMHVRDVYVPKTMVRAFRIEGIGTDGTVHVLATEESNYQRLYIYTVKGTYSAVKLIPLETWGDEHCRLFAFEVE